MKKLVSVIVAICMTLAVFSSVSMSVFANGTTLVGDTDADGKVTILDATVIQRRLASLSVGSFNEAAADADGDGRMTILDATAIQRHLASLPTNGNIGKPLLEEPAVEPAEEPAAGQKTWTLLPDYRYSSHGESSGSSIEITRENAIQSFSLTDDKIIVNGKAYPLGALPEDAYQLMPPMMYFEIFDKMEVKFNMTNMIDIEGETYLLFKPADPMYSSFLELVPLSGSAYLPVYTDKKVKTAELTPDNWQDIFEFRVQFYPDYNEWDDITGIIPEPNLFQKDGVMILKIDKGRIAGSYTVKKISRIRYDYATQEITVSDTRAPEEAWGTGFDEELYPEFYDGEAVFTRGFKDYWVENTRIGESYIDVTGGTEYDVTVSRIRGTVTYLE